MANDVNDFTRSMGIATSGLRAQAGRMRARYRDHQAQCERNCKDGTRKAFMRCPKLVRRHGCPLNIGVQDFRK